MKVLTSWINDPCVHLVAIGLMIVGLTRFSDTRRSLAPVYREDRIAEIPNDDPLPADHDDMDRTVELRALAELRNTPAIPHPTQHESSVAIADVDPD